MSQDNEEEDDFTTDASEKWTTERAKAHIMDRLSNLPKAQQQRVQVRVWKSEDYVAAFGTSTDGHTEIVTPTDVRIHLREDALTTTLNHEAIHAEQVFINPGAMRLSNAAKLNWANTSYSEKLETWYQWLDLENEVVAVEVAELEEMKFSKKQEDSEEFENALAGAQLYLEDLVNLLYEAENAPEDPSLLAKYGFDKKLAEYGFDFDQFPFL